MSFVSILFDKHHLFQWVPESATEAAPEQQAQGGKVELSLLHFTKLNPEFKPKRESRAFLNGMTQQVSTCVVHVLGAVS